MSCRGRSPRLLRPCREASPAGYVKPDATCKSGHIL